MKCLLVEGRRCRGRHGGKAQYQHQISAHPMIFVQALSVCDAAVKLGSEEDSEANERLECKEAVRDKAESAM